MRYIIFNIFLSNLITRENLCKLKFKVYGKKQKFGM